MPEAPPRTADANRRPFIYTGRFIDQVTGAVWPDDHIVLGERDVLPQKLARVPDCASLIVLLDLPSFPLETMTDEHWNVPMVVVLPEGFDAESLSTTFGTALFERLGFFDRIATSDSTLWEELRRKYRWAESQRVPTVNEHPGEVAAAIRTLSDRHEPASSVFDKARHRAQAAVLEPWFAAPRGKRNAEIPLDVLEVGTGVGRWASSFDLTKTRVTGIDVREDLVRTARTNFPEGRFDRLNSNLLFPYEDESFDIVFSVTTMHRDPTPAKQTLLSEMWRVVRPGGRLLFLENFVFAKHLESPDVHLLSITGFVDLIIDAMAGQVVLEHVESLRYPEEDLRRGGLISLLRLGIPKE